MGLSCHCFKGSWIRIRKRNCCSSSVIENQYLIRMVPERTNILSNSGTERKNSSTSSSVQKPMTRSTPARLYQLRSNRTISPPAGKCGTYLWKYHCVRSRSLGAAGSATTRQTRGLTFIGLLLVDDVKDRRLRHFCRLVQQPTFLVGKLLVGNLGQRLIEAN